MPREPIFGPHNEETYKQYLERLQDADLNEYTPASKAAAMMTTVMLMQHGNQNAPINKQSFTTAKKALLKSPVFKQMMRSPKGVELLQSNNTVGLFQLLGNLTTKRQQELDRKYKRPEDKQLVAKLEKEMRQCAKDLEFERAAELRDRIRELREKLIALPE